MQQSVISSMLWGVWVYGKEKQVGRKSNRAQWVHYLTLFWSMRWCSHSKQRAKVWKQYKHLNEAEKYAFF